MVKRVNSIPPAPKVPVSKNERSAEQRAVRRRNRGSGARANWLFADGDKLRQAIASVTQHGGALRFGYTKDGGAYAVGFLGDGDPFTEFPRPTESLDDFLDSIIQDYGEATEKGLLNPEVE
jgi:hypothetical protein